MRTIGEITRAFRETRRRRRAKLPWRELEAEAARQGCSPADIFFDRAGRVVGLLANAEGDPSERTDVPKASSTPLPRLDR